MDHNDQTASASGVGMARAEIPRPGFGTWQLTDRERCIECVTHAIDVGYRHIDTAAAYRNEDAVGEGIRRSGIDRGNLVVATKVWRTDLAGADVPRATRESLDRLGLDYVDVLYVHWPSGAYVADETLPALASLVDDNIVGGIGISNFTEDLLVEAIDVAGDVLLAHQFEMHPYLPNEDLREASLDAGLTVVAYSPLARTEVLDDPTIVELASAHGVSPTQVALAWHMHFDDVVPIPKTANLDRIEENYAATELRLSADEIDRINQIDRRTRVVDPGHAPW